MGKLLSTGLGTVAAVGLGAFLVMKYLKKFFTLGSYATPAGRGSCDIFIGPFVNANKRKRAFPKTMIPRKVVRPDPSAQVSN